MTRNSSIPVLAIVLVLQVAPALAHGQLVDASPGVGSSVPASPSEIRLTFSEGVEPRLSGIEVTNSAGHKIRTTEASCVSGQPTVLVARITSPLPAGAYRVSWRVVSIDTHRTQGSFSFQVGP